jgi:hypothetical protein|tara:strand:- start:7531 stop:7764 length:234 start_codon:yes stop_codon:yes gene_type:complete
MVFQKGHQTWNKGLNKDLLLLLHQLLLGLGIEFYLREAKRKTKRTKDKLTIYKLCLYKKRFVAAFMQLINPCIKKER